MPNNVLVTGGAGYVGSICSQQLLKQGHHVTIVDDLSTGHLDAVPRGAEFHPIDVGNREAISSLLAGSSFEDVFHFAAKAQIAESVSNHGPFFDTNLAS